MAIKSNKKGVFLTMVAIFLVTGLTFFYTSSNSYSYKDASRVVSTRILNMNSFIEDIENDIERGLYIGAMRSLIGMSEFVAENGSFLSNFDSDFNEIMINGTIQGHTLNITKDATFGDWIDRIIDVGSKLDLDISISNMVTIPYQTNPWKVTVKVNGDINITDRKGMASWNRQLNVTTEIEITDFEDPLYTVMSRGKFINKIITSNYTDFSQVENLIKHVNGSLYLASSEAPSFIMRFSGNLSTSPYGIESMVNTDKLKTIAPELYDSGASCVDHIYFANPSKSNCRVNETKTLLSWFRLDNEDSYHLNLYDSNCE